MIGAFLSFGPPDRNCGPGATILTNSHNYQCLKYDATISIVGSCLSSH